MKPLIKCNHISHFLKGNENIDAVFSIQVTYLHTDISGS